MTRQEIYNLTTDELREALFNTLEELSKIQDYCPHCGCTEMLCGHNGPGCSLESDEEE